MKLCFVPGRWFCAKGCKMCRF